MTVNSIAIIVMLLNWVKGYIIIIHQNQWNIVHFVQQLVCTFQFYQFLYCLVSEEFLVGLKMGEWLTGGAERLNFLSQDVI